jgi:parallel beta-helix repeat protein
LALTSKTKGERKMKTRSIATMLLILLVANMLSIMPCVVQNSLAQEDQFGVLDETGTYFELQNVNIFITTDTPVHIMLHASSDMIFYCIENAGINSSTQLTFGTLMPSTTYYMYEDGYENKAVFMTDDVGCYTYDQDLSQLHFIIIQPTPGTVTIYESTTLQSNIYDSVSIEASNVVLDLNGYSIIGGWGIGINIFQKTNVTIKNGGIMNFIAGMAIANSANIVVENCTISHNSWMGVSLMASSYSNTVANNTFSENHPSVELSSVSNNKFYHNNFDSGVSVYQLGGPNIWDDGYPNGGNYWSFYAGTDQYCGPNQDLPGSDGIADGPLVWPLNNIDNYPLMSLGRAIQAWPLRPLRKAIIRTLFQWLLTRQFQTSRLTRANWTSRSPAKLGRLDMFEQYYLLACSIQI